jgi:hypothetical protein
VNLSRSGDECVDRADWPCERFALGDDPTPLIGDRTQIVGLLQLLFATDFNVSELGGSLMHNLRSLTWMLPALILAPFATRAAPRSEFTMSQMLHYPYVTQLAAAERGDVIAWVRNIDGVRNVWVARGPAFTPLQITQYSEDDGQEITQLTFSPDGMRLVFVLGGDHDANWPAEDNLAPDPTSSPEQPKTAIWAAPLTGGAPQKIDEGDEPSISARGQLVYTKDHHVWSAPLGEGKPERLFFDR